LASAYVVDGHKWLYHVCFRVFDSETTENWIWFMSHLREAIGSLRGLTICTDAGQVVMAGVGEVFLGDEYKECMLHLVIYILLKSLYIITSCFENFII
jgi:hypothetical protein